jgi:hypothetical protein
MKADWEKELSHIFSTKVSKIKFYKFDKKLGFMLESQRPVGALPGI